MKTIRAISIGLIIWCLGVASFVLAYSLPIIDNQVLQANVALVLIIIPLVWAGSHFYYKKDRSTKGLLLGTFFFLISAGLDALITVPFLILPQGGSYTSFYSDPWFWLIGLLMVGVSSFYFQAKIRSKSPINL